MPNLIFIEYPTVYWLDLLNELHEKGDFEVYFIEPYAKHYNFNTQELEKKAKFKFHYLRQIKIFKRSFNPGIFSIIKKNDPQYIITKEFSFITLLLIIKKICCRCRYKIIVRCDDSFDMVNNKNEFTRIHRWARKLLMPWVNNVILVEPRVVEWYRHRYQKGILFPIIRNDSLYRQELSSMLNKTNELISQYELKGKKVIAFVGRFIKLKNIDLLIETFLTLASKDTLLFLIGDGKEKISLEKKYQNTQIIFTGNVQGKELLAYYNFISVLALLSEREAFGAVVNEALLAGVKVLVSEKAGASFLVETENGHVIDPYNSHIRQKLLQKILSQVPAITPLQNIRHNLMPFSFEDRINRLLYEITLTK